ncbi:MAG: NYN domain-containing protein [Lachnospiraceae bacterium]|nr:NYN domain-containing protein [Lachnospiraceae bacterium]
MFGFGGDKKPKATVFVDYEHWYYGYRNRYQMKPNVEEWLEELRSEYDIEKLSIFGDFSENNIGNDLKRLRGISKNIVHTASEKDGIDKDFTDVIMLDAIYRSAAKKGKEKVYIIFTGDAHFTMAVKYLKELGKKVVIYGVKFGFSNRLKSEATSYVEMPRQSHEKNHYNDLILESLSKIRSSKNKRKFVTYWKTVKNVAERNHVQEDKVKNALDNLIKQKYINEKQVTGYKGKKMKVLYADWDRMESDGIWNRKGKNE